MNRSPITKTNLEAIALVCSSHWGTPVRYLAVTRGLTESGSHGRTTDTKLMIPVGFNDQWWILSESEGAWKGFWRPINVEKCAPRKRSDPCQSRAGGGGLVAKVVC